MTDLVVVSLEAWDGVWRRNQHLVSRLLAADAELRVLFVEPSVDPLHDVRRRSRRPPRARAPPGRGPAVAVPTDQVAAPQARPGGRPAAVVRRPAGGGQVGMARPVLWLNDPGRRPAAPDGLARALRHHRRLAAGRPLAARARPTRRERALPPRPLPPGGRLLAPAAGDQVAPACGAGDARPERRGRRRLPGRHAATRRPTVRVR